MITVTPFVIDSASRALNNSDYLIYGCISCGVLILALIVRVLLETDNGESQQHKKTVDALGILIRPLTFAFWVIVVYRVLEIIRF